jgi:TfoX/Sxy family transcriptional regulator of competence genes
VKIPKPSDEDKAKFRALVPDDPRVVVKPMFGNLGAFVNGNMFMGLFGADIGVKLPEHDAAKLAQTGGGPFGPAERPMSGYVSLPPSMSPATARAHVDRALGFVAGLPAKKPKQPKKAGSGR